MKQFLSLLCIASMLSLGSCRSNIHHGGGHPSVNKAGQKDFRTSQKKLAASFGGVNMHRPNKFKKKHF